MRFNDAVVGAVMLVISGAIWLRARTFPGSESTEFFAEFGPGFFPSLVAALLAVCGILLIIKGLWERSSQAWMCAPKWWSDKDARIGVFSLAGAGVLYVLVSDFMGFVPTAFILLSYLVWIFSRRYVFAAVSGAVMTAGFYTVFIHFLNVPLPEGFLAGF